MTCDQVESLLLEFVEGDLPAEQCDLLRAHIEECGGCAMRVSETRRMLDGLSAARSIDSPKDDGNPHGQRRGAGSTTVGMSGSVGAQSAGAGTAPASVGDFDIVDELGRGGMGVVYRARQKSLNRVVALKLLSPMLVQSQRTITRFLKEAQAAARLHHTNIVPIYDQGEDHGTFYYAMELVDGEPLSGVIARDPTHVRLQAEGAHTEREIGARDTPTAATGALVTHERTPTRGRRADANAHVPHSLTLSLTRLLRSSAGGLGDRGRRDFKRIARLLAEVADGLHHAHEQGVIHRDIKPQNLLLGRDDRLHITDFGLARLLDEPGLTLSAEIVGTPAYMSPEQVSGDRSAVDRRTDIFALGVTLYEILTLRRPFPGDNYDQVITSILKRDPLAPRRIDAHVPVDLETICLRAIEKEKARRFATAADMARDLRRYAEDFPIVSRRVSLLGKASRWVRRHPARAAAIGAATIIVALLPVLWHFVQVSANARIDQSIQSMRDDYRNTDRALDDLGWARWFGGDRRRAGVALAFARVRNAPAEAVALLRPMIQAYPNDAEIQFLLAWAEKFRDGRYEDIMQHVRRGNELAESASPVTPEGLFFRGQALVEYDPQAARYSFEQAIVLANRQGWTFLQAMEHKSRAINYYLYLYRTLSNEHYAEARESLEFVSRLRPTKAFPRYLLSTTHLLAAQIYETNGQPADAERAYAACLKAAESAREAESTSARGYAAEALYHESRHDFEEAIEWWRRIRDDTVTVRLYDRMERDLYVMRLCFALGDHAGAEAARRSRAADAKNEGIREALDAVFFEALIAASVGDCGRAGALVDHVLSVNDGNAERVILMQSLRRFVDPVHATRVNRPMDCSLPLSPKWTPAWREALAKWYAGALDWETLLRAVDTDDGVRPEDRQFLLAGAWFYRAMAELADGRRTAALTNFETAARHYDNENYCFGARFMVYRMQRDPTWPSWITPQDSTTQP